MRAFMLVPIIVLGAGLIIVERVFPARALPVVRGWWWRVAVFNAAQLGVVVLAGYTWDRWLGGVSLLRLGVTLSVAQGALAGYLVSTFVYYWWHRVRHEVNALWLLCHQLHHSPERIEVVTSFYKHPVELLCNSLLSSATSYALLGLTIEQAAWVTAISAAAEFFYHLNVNTPPWLGYFIQRPEMHRVHHERGRHTGNFGDLPVWDLLFGTFRNPARGEEVPCGFKDGREQRIADMLCFRNVNGPLPAKRSAP